MGSIASHFYVQEVRYDAGAWMHRSVYVQEVRYDAGAWMAQSDMCTYHYVENIDWNIG